MANEHVKHKCYDDQDYDDCIVCSGGLYWCVTCGGAEGHLPTECPGRKMTENEDAAVGHCKLDFVGGAWVNK